MKAKLISKAKRFISTIKTHNYNYESNKQAKAALKAIEGIKGKTDPKLITQANEYAKDVLGSRVYAPWLRAHSAMCGTFKEGWIPENYFGNIIVPNLQGETGATSFLKSLSKKIFHSNQFPDIGYFVNGSFYSEEYEHIDQSKAVQYLFQDNNRIVYKLNNSFQGRGLFVFDTDSFAIENLKRLGDGVFQRYIQQHQFFNAIMPNSAATIRILTVMNQLGAASVRAVYLRVGRNRDTHVTSNSQIAIPVNIENGKLNEYGHLKSWYVLESHPDTGFEFKDKVIPHFQGLLKKALELQNAMAFVKCIGWDMIVDTNNHIQVMEWNGFHTGIGFAEFTQGPCFKDLGWERLWRNQ